LISTRPGEIEGGDGKFVVPAVGDGVGVIVVEGVEKGPPVGVEVGVNARSGEGVTVSVLGTGSVPVCSADSEGIAVVEAVPVTPGLAVLDDVGGRSVGSGDVAVPEGMTVADAGGSSKTCRGRFAARATCAAGTGSTKKKIRMERRRKSETGKRIMITPL
jgi:hypothetical protein